MAKLFARSFRVIGFFNHARKRVLVVPFVFLSIIMPVTVNEENQALLASLRHWPWGWQDAG
ncbi:MAG: hypothetical protein V3T03_03900 [Candidatus Bipolaricaulota bacterium]